MLANYSNLLRFISWLVGGLEHLDYLTHMFQRGRYTTNQTVMFDSSAMESCSFKDLYNAYEAVVTFHSCVKSALKSPHGGWYLLHPAAINHGNGEPRINKGLKRKCSFNPEFSSCHRMVKHSRHCFSWHVSSFPPLENPLFAWCFGTFGWFFHAVGNCIIPNWLVILFFRGVGLNHQPDVIR